MNLIDKYREAEKQIAALTAERDAAIAREGRAAAYAERLRTALLAVQWRPVGDGQYTCNYCHRPRSTGHTADCEVAQALRPDGGIAERRDA